MALNIKRTEASDQQSKLSILGECLVESAVDLVNGTVDFFTSRRSTETELISERINSTLGIENRAAIFLSTAAANLIYFVGAPFHDAGTALGEGIAAAYIADNSIAQWEGVGTAVLGAIAGTNLAIGGVASFRMPIPIIKVPTPMPVGNGALVLAVARVSVPGAQELALAGALAAAGIPGNGLPSSQIWTATGEDVGARAGGEMHRSLPPERKYPETRSELREIFSYDGLSGILRFDLRPVRKYAISLRDHIRTMEAAPNVRDHYMNKLREVSEGIVRDYREQASNWKSLRRRSFRDNVLLKRLEDLAQEIDYFPTPVMRIRAGGRSLGGGGRHWKGGV